MERRLGLFLEDRRTLSRDESITVPFGFWSGSVICQTAGQVVVELEGAVTRAISVDAGDVIEFASLPVRRVISKSDSITVSVVAVPLLKPEIPYINVRKAFTSSKLLNSAGNVINPSTEDTLALIKAQTDKLQFDANNFLRNAIASSEIQVPVDLQSVLPKKAELYGADETVAQSVSLDIGGFKLVEVVAKATTATTFKVEYSFDNVHWFSYYTSPTAETSYNDVFWTCAQYIRVSSDPAGVAGDTVSLVVGAKP